MPSREDHGELRTYGRRKGHRLSARKQALIDNLLPRLRLDCSKPPSNIATLFPQQVKAVALEIGFGAGEHLCEQAELYPDWGFIGCEVYMNGVAAALSAIDRKGIGNIRIHDGDAREVLDWLPEGSLERIFVLFPDPWPKKRHQKRRLVSPDTVPQFARVLRPGGELRIASDISDYVRTSLVALRGCAGLEWTAERAADWRMRPGDWPQTRYERKALEAGRACAYLSFRRS